MNPDRSQFFDTTSTLIAEGKVKDNSWTTANMYIKWNVSFSRATLLYKIFAKNVPLRQFLMVNVNSQLKSIRNIWLNIINWIFQDGAIIQFILMHRKDIEVDKLYAMGK